MPPPLFKRDLARRDFSVNAMAVPLAEDQPGLLDPFNGLADLEIGRVRILHCQSFTDDSTRIFRALRYEQRLGFKIEDETLGHLGRAVGENRIAGLSGDRVRHELERIFQEERPEFALGRALELGVLAAIHPAWAKQDVKARLCPLAEYTQFRGEPLDILVWLSGLSYTLDRSQGESLVQRLNMPRAWQRAVGDSIYLYEIEPQLGSSHLPNSSLVHLLEGCLEEAVLAASIINEPATVQQRLREYLDRLRHLTADLDGVDLQALGVVPGPELGRILERLRDARLDGAVSTKAEQLRMVQDIIAAGTEAAGFGQGVGHA